jgi:NAD-specific glutamate dehydrogenase
MSGHVLAEDGSETAYSRARLRIEIRLMSQLQRKITLLAMATLGSNAFAQSHSFTWQELRDRLQTSNPTLRAAAISIDESRAQEITAYLRPNPDLTFSWLAPFGP